MKDKLLSAWNWLVTSSADPDKLALTVKGGLPFVVLAASLFNRQLDANDLLLLVHQAATLLTGAITFYALCRKVYLTSRS